MPHNHSLRQLQLVLQDLIDAGNTVHGTMTRLGANRAELDQHDFFLRRAQQALNDEDWREPLRRLDREQIEAEGYQP